MTYVNKGSRLFLDRGDIKPERRRSESRLKTYPSAIDIRAWCDIVEFRRQHILELITKGPERCLGKLIPLEAIVNALVAGRILDIEKLKKCLSQLWKFIDCIDLKAADKEKLAILRKEMDPICGEQKGMIRTRKLDDECVAKARHEKELAEINALLDDSGEERGGTYKVITKGPAKITTRVKGFRPGVQLKPTPTGGTITTRAQGPAKIKTTVKNAFSNLKSNKGPEAVNQDKSQISSRSIKETPQEKSQKQLPPISQKNTQETLKGKSQEISQKQFPSQRNIQESLLGKPQKSSLKQLPQASPRNIQEKSQHKTPVLSKNQIGGTRREQLNEVSFHDPLFEETTFDVMSEQESTTVALTDFEAISNLASEHQNKPSVSPRMKFSTSDKSNDLKIQLEARETLCNDLQATLEHMKNEKNECKKKLDATLEELETLKKLNAASPIIPASCKQEIEALELEIKVMRSGNLSPEQEAAVIKKEVDVLKKYCLKLKSVEDENEKLKLERDTLKSQVQISEDTGSKRYKSTKDSLNRQVAGISHHSEKNESEKDDDELQSVLKNLEEITKERDMLANKVQRLEKELLQFRDLPEDVEVYRNRSKMLDSALEERDKMSKKVEQIKDMEDELNQLRKKSATVDELEAELKSYSKNDKTTGSELKKSKSRCMCLEKELQNVKMERDCMCTRIECMKNEIESLRAKNKEAEIHKLERDKLQIRLNELSHIQVEYENLMMKCKCLESIAAEKEMYKQKYEGMLTTECQGDKLRNQIEAAKNVERERNSLIKQVGDLESCICDQEEEIKKLVMQIDHLCRNKDDNQCRMREALACMRAEIEKKDYIIAESEEKLACVQTQLKSSIQGVSCETTYYKTRIEDLERELRKAKAQTEALRRQNKGIEQLTKSECQTVLAMKQELKAAKEENKKLREIADKMAILTGDEHVQNMLKQSQCAVKRVVEELGRQYKEWDNMKRNQQKSRKKCPCKMKRVSDSESNEKLIEELEDIQREKKKLEQLVQQIQNDKCPEGTQNELILLQMDNAKLKEQLEKEIKQRRALEKRCNITV